MKTLHDTKSDRILGLFREFLRLNGEQVTKLYEERYGRQTVSNCTHTTVSKLTRQGYLRQIYGGSKTEAGHTVDLWELVEEGVTPQADPTPSAKSPKQLREEVALLEAINRSKEAQINGLIEKLSVLQDELSALKK